MNPTPNITTGERMSTLADQFNARGADALPGHLGLVITHVSPTDVRSELAVKPTTMAPNGFLHAGSVVTLADTSCGYGCVANLPKDATGFTTIELKSNHLGTAREGTIDCVATPVHLGRTTQVWDATVTHRETGKTIALFRCTQMVLYPKA
jgi:1,4-dihydroxy-2-naphthoyl-CoA hydrolase